MKIRVTLQPRKTSLILGGIVLLFALLHMIAHVFINPDINDIPSQIGMIFDMDREVSVPTWYNQMLFVGAAFLLFIIGCAKRQKVEKYYRHWIGLGWIFVFLSIDEGASMHEVAGPILAELFRDQITFTSYLYFAWVIVGMLFFILVGTIYFRFWLDLPKKTKWLFLLSAAVFLAGAVGMEMLGAHYVTSGNDFDYYYSVLACVEELGEQMGIVLFIYTLLAYAANHSLSTSVHIQSDDEPMLKKP